MSGIVSQNVGRPSGLVKAADAGGGAWTLIETLTSDGSDATMDFTSGIDGTYGTYVFTFKLYATEFDFWQYKVRL